MSYVPLVRKIEYSRKNIRLGKYLEPKFISKAETLINCLAKNIRI